MEIQVLVGDENDNKPVCENEHNIFEVQEDEPVGKMCVSGSVSERIRIFLQQKFSQSLKISAQK